MKRALKAWWDDEFLRYLTIGLIVLGVILVFWNPTEAAPVDAELSMDFYFLPTCPHCHEEMEWFPTLKQQFPELQINSYDVSTANGQRAYIEHLTRLGHPPDSIRVPVTIINDTIIRGFSTPETTGEEIIAALHGEAVEGDAEQCSTESDCDKPVELSLFGWDFTINPADYSLPALAIILGAVDGFNPCAMWVLVYLISLVMVLDNKKRAWLLVGIFLAASGIMYFLFMTAWLQVFLFVGLLRPVQILIGLFALGVGIANLKTWWETKGALQCEVGDLKSKAKTSKRVKDLINSPLTWGAILGMVALAFTVNSIEFMCSFGIPAVFAEVLAVSPLTGLQHYALIALYVLMYMIDDLIIFALAIFAVQSTAGDKYAKHCKLIAGVIMVLLGIILTFFPGFLAALA